MKYPKSNTKRHHIELLANEGLSPRETFIRLRPMVEAQTAPMIYRANVNGSRVPKGIRAQLIELRHDVNRTFALLGKEGYSDPGAEFSEEEFAKEMELPSEDDEIETAAEQAEEVEKSAKPAASGKQRIEHDKRFFFSEWKRIKKWCEDRLTMNDPIDSISMRPILAAKTGIPNGIPARALLHAMAIHWPSDVRQSAGIEDFSFEALAEVTPQEVDKLNGEKVHNLTGYALKLARARIPIMLVGPSGSGKSKVAAQIADILELDYAETPMTAGATPSWLLGSWTMQGFTTRKFLEIYANGGVFNFEEIDAADPNLLLVANNALASDKLFNPVNGEVYHRHPDFIPVSTANTFGLGGNREFTGRERLDGATIDRWRMGRIVVPIDEALAEGILFG
jgi:hypothetical protein